MEKECSVERRVLCYIHQSINLLFYYFFIIKHWCFSTGNHLPEFLAFTALTGLFLFMPGIMFAAFILAVAVLPAYDLTLV
jgi:hypothetical protein